MSKPECLVVSVFRCARCGCDHEELTFNVLDNPIRDMTHWCPCPNNKEPILLRIIPE